MNLALLAKLGAMDPSEEGWQDPFYMASSSGVPWLVGLLIGLGLLLVVAPILYVLYFLCTLPWRRRERAAVLLDLLELGLREGHSPESTLVSLARLPAAGMPVRIHLLAAYVESGLGLSEALNRVAHLVPPAIQKMLQVGLRHGDLARTLELCRKALPTAINRQSGMLVYLLVLLTGSLVIAPAVVLFEHLISAGRLNAIIVDLAGGNIRSRYLDTYPVGIFVGLGLAILSTLALGSVLTVSIGGPRILRSDFGTEDHWVLFIPWIRDRVQRDFALMLSFLLDMGVPEAVALREAAEATANDAFRKRGDRAIQRLAKGELFAVALRELDTSGEFRWRLENARHGLRSTGQSHFVEALEGWIKTLTVRADQGEIQFIQTVATSVLLCLGMTVGLQCVSVFGVLIEMIEVLL